MGVDWGHESAFSCFHEFESSLVQEFKLFQEFELFWEFALFQKFCEILKNSQAWHSAIAAGVLALDWSLGGEKNCIVYSLFCIVIIIIIIIILSSSITNSISISFVALLNCLYLNTRVSPFSPFLLPIPLRGKGRGEQVAV